MTFSHSNCHIVWSECRKKCVLYRTLYAEQFYVLRFSFKPYILDVSLIINYNFSVTNSIRACMISFLICCNRLIIILYLFSLKARCRGLCFGPIGLTLPFIFLLNFLAIPTLNIGVYALQYNVLLVICFIYMLQWNQLAKPQIPLPRTMLWSHWIDASI